MKFSDYTIVVMSCDSYSDIWPYFGKCWHCFWPNCPFETFLISEEKEFKHPSIGNIRIGRRVGWSEMLLTVLEKVNTPYIIYLQEDYLLKGPTDMERLTNLLSFFEEHQAGYLRLFPWPKPQAYDNTNSEAIQLGPDEAYRTSLQTAIWDVKTLQKLLIKEESGWDFETKGNERSKSLEENFYSVTFEGDFLTLNQHQHIIDYYATGVLRGKWMKPAVKHFRNLGITINPGKRGVLSRWDYWYYDKYTRRAIKPRLLIKWLNDGFFTSRLFQRLHNMLMQF